MKAMKVIKAMTVMKVCERCFFRYTHFADACAADVSQNDPASAAAEGAANVSQHVPASPAAEGVNAAFIGIPILLMHVLQTSRNTFLRLLRLKVLQTSRNTFLRLLRLEV
jgi:hypothetical protein